MWTISVYFSVPALSSDYPPLCRVDFCGNLFLFYGIFFHEFFNILYICCAVPFFAGRDRGLFRRPGRFLAKFSSRIRFSNLHWAVLLNLHGAQVVKGKGGASHCTVRADLQITVNHYNKSHTPFLGRPGRPFSKPRPACRALLDVPI